MGLMSREKSVGQDERPSPILPGFPQSAMMRSMRLTKRDPSRPVKKTNRPLQRISFLPVTMGGHVNHTEQGALRMPTATSHSKSPFLVGATHFRS